MPSIPPRRLITTKVLPPVLPAKEACIIDSPNIWVIAMPPPRTAPVLSSERRDIPVREKSGQPQSSGGAGGRTGVIVISVPQGSGSGGHVVGGVEQGRGQARERPAGEHVRLVDDRGV